ncbi:MAG: FKBP-type peptidyl-prolyl cis-trans isomerase [Chitinophaga sp.]|uniref:FKBP-type peptidyl-prolyl cis-trans isomerase n=1 Tax=Chitinophaga sp. TaxID=1869181 RepID=UPI001B2C20E7|nr:FKBP-type peptidyl-prolyl cis-trans isomerase [Chitinophaga sp.]MBO9728176.1 FKBP-type peptidyl-prolyl cis-trans isomerase [Chitinophaga sp.]
MKKVFLFGGLFLLMLAACSKKDDNNTPPYDKAAQYTIDSTKIMAYAAANNITDLKHDSAGIFYQIVNRGDTRDTANAAAYVNVAYIGTFLDKKVFDSSYNANFGLNRVIEGWTIGIPKIGRGGEINLLLPSYFAYRQYGQGSVPPNTVLIFNVKLKSFTNR